jgi:hypothetical protein
MVICLQILNILNRWKNYFTQLLNMHSISDIRHKYIQLTLVLLRLKLLLQSWESINLQVVIKFWQNWFKQEVKHYCEIHKLIQFGIRENCLISERNQLLHQFTYRAIKLTVVNSSGISLLSTSYKILSNILLSRLSPCRGEVTGDQLCEFWCNRSTTDQIICSHQILKEKLQYNETVHQIFIVLKRAYDSIWRYCILVDFGVPM